VLTEQAGLLTCGHRFPTPSRRPGGGSGNIYRVALAYSGGTVPDFHRTSLFS